jgi:NADH:ubiquinone oxidoreductase subunit 6 (subunit J)
VSVTILWVALAAISVIGGATVVFARELTRLLLGLGAFFLGVAGLYAYYGFELLAVAELFVYVGGVLVLFLFAIAAMGRDTTGRSIGRRSDFGAGAVSIGLAGALLLALRTVLPAAQGAGGVTVEKTADVLLGGLLPHFEALGGLLLVALVAALAIVGGGEE